MAGSHPSQDNGEDFEAVWAQIVAGFESDGQLPDASQAAGVAGPKDGTAALSPEAGGDANGMSGLAALFEPLRHDDDHDEDLGGAQPLPAAHVDSWADEGRFVPPEPPELPEGTPVKRLGWAGTLGGPAVLALIAVSGWDPPHIVPLAAGLAFLAGFATLVWQLPNQREDGWDDGARL